LLDRSLSRDCTANSHECFNAFAVQGTCYSQSLVDLQADPQREDPAQSFTEYFENLIFGNYHSSAFNDSNSRFPDLGIEQPPQDLTIINSTFLTASDNLEAITGIDPTILLSQHFAIDQALEKQAVDSEGDAQRSGEESGVTSTKSSSSSSPLSTSSQSSTIHCSWPTCQKEFKNRSDYNHHCRYHNLPFQCPSCPLRQATKSELNRHINSVHFPTEKYYCRIATCNRSLNGNGKPFSRQDGCRKHMKTRHRMTNDQVGICRAVKETKRIRRHTKEARRAVN